MTNKKFARILQRIENEQNVYELEIGQDVLESLDPVNGEVYEVIINKLEKKLTIISTGYVDPH